MNSQISIAYGGTSADVLWEFNSSFFFLALRIYFVVKLFLPFKRESTVITLYYSTFPTRYLRFVE